MNMSRKEADDYFCGLASKKYREFSEIPFPVDGRISFHKTHHSAETDDCGDIQETLITLETQWYFTNVLRNKRSGMSKTIFLPSDDLGKAHSTPFQSCDEKVVWNVASPSGRQRAVCIAEDDKYYIEIWRHHELVHIFNVTSQKKHGRIHKSYAEGTIGCFAWSNSESHIIYLAEKYQPENKETFYDWEAPKESSAMLNGKESKSDSSKSKKGESHVLEENFGEQLTNVKHPILCLLHVDEGIVSVLWPQPNDESSTSEEDEKSKLDGPYLPLTGVWCPDDTGILIVATENGPYRLGYVYCTQRPSLLQYLHFESAKCELVGHEKRAVTSPRFSSDGKYAVWLEQDPWGPHYQCKRLIGCDWATKEIYTVIEVVEKAGEAFPGIFSINLTERCWSSDNKRIILSSQWRTRVELLIVNTQERLGKKIELPDGGLTIGNVKLLDIAPYEDLDLILVQFSSPSRPPYLAIACLPPDGKEDKIVWHTVRIGCEYTLTTLPFMSWHINKHVPDLLHPIYGAVSFESLLLLPQKRGSSNEHFIDPLPVILLPHGGPHSAFSAGFSVYLATLVACGFAVLAVNYRGSTGFGQESLTSLLGHVGEIDVADCMQALRDVVGLSSSGTSTEEEFSSFSGVERKLDPNRIVLFGGSHGGFLVAHLMGQHPTIFRAACARNPVINIVSMIGSTDIPDWCIVETCPSHLYMDKHRTDPYRALVPTGDMITAMWKASPIRWVDHMRTPLMLVVGGADLRVPKYQGKELFNALKSRQVPVKMYYYEEDCHPLERVSTESEVIVNLVRWYARWLELPFPAPHILNE